MKKLMIAAATAAMVGGAFASLCDEGQTVDQCAVYNVKFTLKTLDAKLIKVRGADVCTGTSAYQGCTYLDNATRTIDGIIWDCATSCATLNDGAGGAEMKVALWEAKSKRGVGDLLQLVDDPSGATDRDGNPIKVYAANNLPFDVINRYGKKAEKVQAKWQIPVLKLNNSAEYVDSTDYGKVDLTAAGFGTFDAKKAIVKSISGNAVGTFDQTLTDTGCGDPQVLGLCDAFDTWCDTYDVADALVASGTWSVKYNASLSKGKKRLGQIVPAYAQAR